MDGTYIIIGGSGGVGSAVAEKLNERGAKLALVAQDEEKLAAVAEPLGARHYVADFTDNDAATACIKQINEECGPIRGVVHAVGSILLKPTHLTTPAEFDATIQKNLTSAFIALRASIPVLKDDGGSVVFFSSAAARIGMANHEPIAAAKAGIEGLVRAAAATYASKGIRVNAIAPGLVDTPLSKRIMSSEAGMKASLAMHPAGRIGKPADIATPVVWLLDPASDWVTGQVISVDGGLAALKVPRG